MTKRLLVMLAVTGALWMQSHVAVRAADDGPTYSGVEFFGSSQISHLELEKELGIKPGARLEAVFKAATRLQKKLEERRLPSTVEVVTELGKSYVAVDIADPSSGVPLRKLDAPHRVYLSNELPFNILDQMSARMQKLADEGRPATVKYENGIKFFSDEPLNQFAEKLLKAVPPMRSQFFQMIANDPDSGRRRHAVEVLNWDTRPVQDVLDLAPALDDATPGVRLAADSFIRGRLDILPDNFPIQVLVEAFSRELSRPSHSDRVAALKSLLTIARVHPFALGSIKAADEERLKLLQSQSVLSSIKEPAAQLLDACAHLPERPTPRKQRQLNEF
jgi:hypothetical protein